MISKKEGGEYPASSEKDKDDEEDVFRHGSSVVGGSGSGSAPVEEWEIMRDMGQGRVGAKQIITKGRERETVKIKKHRAERRWKKQYWRR